MALQVRIQEEMAGGTAMPALEIAKRCSLKTKKDVNPTLYSMEKQGLIRVLKEENPPRFQLLRAGPALEVSQVQTQQAHKAVAKEPSHKAVPSAQRPPSAAHRHPDATNRSSVAASENRPHSAFMPEARNVSSSTEEASELSGPVQPRSYQLEAFEKIKDGNTIVHLPTGKGKTLIAALAIDHFVVKQPGGVVAFVVPTCPLISQQAKYCREHCKAQVHVVELNNVDDRKVTWAPFLEGRHVLVGTPEAFRHAMVDNQNLGVERLSLLILDECHNATGNSPMSQMLQDAVLAKQPHLRPRILGLTASFVNGKMKEPVTRREQLEALLDATIFCPLDVAPTSQLQQHVEWEKEETLDLLMSDLKLEQERLLTQALDSSDKGCGQMSPQILRALKVQSASAALEEVLSGPLDTSKVLSQDVVLRPGFPLEQFEASGNALTSDCDPDTGPKSVALLRLLRRVLEEKKQDSSYKGVIFVKRICLAQPLADFLSEFLKLRDPSGEEFPKQVGVVTGTGSMTDAKREETLISFRQGLIRLLVSTAALEEGLNVPDCAFVVRFDRFDTSKSHIQGSGRARLEQAEVYYFCNDPALEQERAKEMLDVASDLEHGLTPEERAECHAQLAALEVPGVHPFRGDAAGGAELNFFTALAIVYQYAQKVRATLGNKSPFSPDEDLFTYAPEVSEDGEVVGRTTCIERVTYPAHDGPRCITAQEVNAHWKGVSVADVLAPARCRKLNQKDIEKRRALFVVAVTMRRNGHLTPDNRPSLLALHGESAIAPSSRSNGNNGSACVVQLPTSRRVCLMHGGRQREVRLPMSMTVLEILQQHCPKALSDQEVELVLEGCIQGAHMRVMDLPGALEEVIAVEIRQAEEW